jgi:hypothetical protein
MARESAYQEKIHFREFINVRGRDLGMEGTRRGREGARKIFENRARSGLRNARL